MKLHILGSSSKGNCYILQGQNETLILEAGVKLAEVKQALDFDLSSVVGCLVTHEHKDHSKYIGEYLKAAIPVVASQGTLESCGIKNHNAYSAKHRERVGLGNFSILPLEVIHDAAEPLGFRIYNPECGELLFITDTHYIPYRFQGLNNIICEVNYDLDIANENIANGAPKSVRDRVLETHMELSTFIKFLGASDMSKVNNIVLCHLSDGNSNSRQFKERVEEAVPGKTVTVADKNIVINLDKTPF